LFGRVSLLLPKILAINSRAGLENLTKMGRTPQSMLYLPNVVDTERFFPSDRRPTDEFHLIMVGRMSAPKRFDIFLRILADFKQHYKHLPVIGHLVGDGPQHDALKSLALNLGLEPAQVHFHGAVENVEVLFQQAHLCLHLSDWEGMPNAVLEAMACGLPVLATRVGGIAELVQDKKTGYLFQPDSLEDLLASVIRLIQNEELRNLMGHHARDFVVRQRDLSSLSIRLIETYKAIGV
jgi:glycosyltransferase involved in cell wall biosynthesis